MFWSLLNGILSMHGVKCPVLASQRSHVLHERQAMSTKQCRPKTKFQYEDIKIKLEAQLSEEWTTEPSLPKTATAGAPVANFYEIEEELLSMSWNHHPHTDVEDRCPQPLATTLQQVCVRGTLTLIQLPRRAKCYSFVCFCSGTLFPFKLTAIDSMPNFFKQNLE